MLEPISENIINLGGGGASGAPNGGTGITAETYSF